jgi:hypothetical protein
MSFNAPSGPLGKSNMYTSRPITVVGTPTSASKTLDTISTYFLESLDIIVLSAIEDINAISAAIDEI